ncbi:MAG TPA: hypothetical protein VNN06_08130 [Ramlibacter sp.]|nr:hypothetical protein [Ramlibacter sp.]
MNPASSSSRPGGREPADERAESDAGAEETPSTDMQPEDAGTADSGNTGRSTAGDRTMKQDSRTEQAPGPKR